MKDNLILKKHFPASLSSLTLVKDLRRSNSRLTKSMYSQNSNRADSASERTVFESDTISPREMEVLLLISKEYTNDEIAWILHISPHTAISHRKNIMRKWDVKNTAGLIRKGFELGFPTV